MKENDVELVQLWILWRTTRTSTHTNVVEHEPSIATAKDRDIMRSIVLRKQQLSDRFVR